MLFNLLMESGHIKEEKLRAYMAEAKRNI